MSTAKAVRGAFFALLVVVAGACQPGAPSDAGSDVATTSAGVDPVIDQDFPDPDTLLVGDTYYAYATQPTTAGHNVQVATSTNLTEWEVLPDDPLPELPKWATAGRTWAPEVTKVGDGYVLYFTARSVKPDQQCIGAATATKPLGPFKATASKPLVCPKALGGAIDAASFVDDGGTRYLLWKNDGNCCGKDTWIFLQKTSPDGLRLVGKQHRLIKQDQLWEGELVEAPTLVKRDGVYTLLYSANSYAGAEYATGYATAKSVTGPYTKAEEPLLSTDGTGDRYTGPGGQDVLTDADGGDHLVFHDWDDAVFYRGMHVVDLEWKDGRPVPVLPEQ